MEISITDFRCFHETEPVQIRPINILVGENSAGKTSFLAATRFLFDLFDRQARASFNKEPFHLGAYENIAHYRGGRFGRAQSFGFRVTGHINSRGSFFRQQGSLSKTEVPPQMPFSLAVQFAERRSQPAIRSVVFDAAPYGFRIATGERTEFVIKTPSCEAYELESEAFLVEQDASAVDLSFLEFSLRSVMLRQGRDVNDTAVNQPSREEFDVLFRLYSSAIRSVPSNVYASSPVRTRPERTYNPTDFTIAPDGAHIPFVLAQMNYFEPEKWEDISKTLADFGISSGLFRDVYIKKISKSGGGPFQIVVNLDGRKSNIIDVGYGVSQALPIVTDVLRARRSSLFLFQQPEVHLHPKAQAALGTFFAQIVRKQRHTFFIETHSDYLIDRVRMCVREGKDIRPQDVGILYFERDGHDVKIHMIEIDRLGNLIGTPPGYRRFFLEEEMRSIGLGAGHAVDN